MMPLTPQPYHTRRAYLLGQFRVETAGQAIPLRGGKIRALLAYLLLYPERPHHREQLADILWPDAPVGRVRRQFSDTLYRLRQALGEEWLAVDREFVGLADTAVLWTDVWAFEQAVASGQPEQFTAALDLYGDDLLPEIYDDWILGRRLGLRESFLDALLTLGQAAENSHQPAAALACFQRLAQADPLREEAHRGVMRALAGLNRLPDALEAYARLESLLQAELAVPPAPRSQELARQLRDELHLTQKAAELAGENLVQRPFVGRITERRTLFTALDNAINGQSCLITLEGEAGIGKSRLLAEIKAGAEWRKITVVDGRTADTPDASPFAPLAHALQNALTPPRPAQIAAMLLPEMVAAAAPLLPDLPAAPLPDLPPERTRDRFHQAVAALFGALAELGPHLLILDDMHRADAALWAVLDALIPAISRQKLVLLLAYRRPGIEDSPGWPVLQSWQETGQLHALNLQPFSAAELREWLPANFHDELKQIHALTGGNPFYVSEVMIALAEGQAPHGRTAVTRAQSLPETTQQALAAAAVIGQSVTFQGWAQISGHTPANLAQIGDELTAHYLLQPTDTGYAFPHELIHQAIYEQIPADDCRRLHRQMADWLAQSAPERWRARAFHLDQAGAPEAAAVYQQAGAQAAAQFAFAEAVAAYDRALALLPAEPTAERVELLLALAQAAQVTGERDPQQQALEEALRHTAVLDDPALQLRVYRLTGAAAAKTGQHEAAQSHLDKTMKLAVAQHDIPSQLDILLSLGDLAIRLGEPESARTHFETAVTLARQHEQPQFEGRALDGVGFAMMNGGGDMDEALANFQQALAQQRAIGDQFGASRTLVNILSTYQNTGAWDKVLGMAEEAYQAQTAVSYRQGMAAVRQAEGLAACMLGDFAAARQAINQAMAGFEAAGDQIGIGIALDALGLIAEREGKLAEAADYFRQAIRIAQAANAATFAAYARQDLGILCAQMGDFDDAIPLLEAAVATWRTSGDQLNSLKCEACLALSRLEKGQQAQAKQLADSGWSAFQTGGIAGEEPQVWLWTLHRLMQNLNCHMEADQILEAAYSELQTQAQAISNHEMRRRFFTDVPTNREIVAALGKTQQIEVTLARKDAPLGRPLTPDEKATIQWTLTAPEDETITAKSDRRRFRLLRLVREADAQDAAPTDDDLAQALGVSRRTVLRDMEALRATGGSLPTRRRGND